MSYAPCLSRYSSPSHTCIGAFALLVVPFSICEAQNVATQAAGADHLAIEAENFSSIEYAGGATGNILTQSGFIPVDLTTAAVFQTLFGTRVLPSGTNASGGGALLDSTLTQSPIPGSIVRYKIIFSREGVYRLYMRASMYEASAQDLSYTNEDLLWVSRPFGEVPEATAGNTTDLVQFTDLADQTPRGVEGIYRWRNSLHNYTIEPADIGQEKEFIVRDRSAGLSIDRIIFSLNRDLLISSINEDNLFLDGLANSPLDGEVSDVAPELRINYTTAGLPEIRWNTEGSNGWVLRRNSALVNAWQDASPVQVIGSENVHPVSSGDFSANPRLFFRLER